MHKNGNAKPKGMFVLYLSYPINNSRNLTHYVKVEVGSLSKFVHETKKSLMVSHQTNVLTKKFWRKFYSCPSSFFTVTLENRHIVCPAVWMMQQVFYLCFCNGNYSLHICIFYFFPNIITIIPRDRKTSHLKFLFSPLQYAVRLIFRVFYFLLYNIQFVWYSEFVTHWNSLLWEDKDYQIMSTGRI